MNRNLFVLVIGAALFATIVYASGERLPAAGPPGQVLHISGDVDGVTVTYQDPDRDGDYETATVGDIDLPGRHITTVRIVDVDPFERVLARGQRRTSGTTSVVTFSDVLLASEIEDSDLVRVTLRAADGQDDDDDDDDDDRDDDDNDDDEGEDGEDDS